MDWIRLHTRLAIYARDSFDCVYCQSVFPPDPLGYGLSLDHLRGRRDHRPANLITACVDCNTERGTMPLREWIALLESRGQVGVLERINARRALPLDVELGHRLAVQRRPNYRRNWRHSPKVRARLLRTHANADT